MGSSRCYGWTTTPSHAGWGRQELESLHICGEPHSLALALFVPPRQVSFLQEQVGHAAPGPSRHYWTARPSQHSPATSGGCQDGKGWSNKNRSIEMNGQESLKSIDFWEGLALDTALGFIETCSVPSSCVWIVLWLVLGELRMLLVYTRRTCSKMLQNWLLLFVVPRYSLPFLLTLLCIPLCPSKLSPHWAFWVVPPPPLNKENL